MSRRQRDHSVAESVEPVHPIGVPMSHSTKAGLSCGGELGVSLDNSGPRAGVVRSGWPNSPSAGVELRRAALRARAASVVAGVHARAARPSMPLIGTSCPGESL
jgi:hypothetical protein